MRIADRHDELSDAEPLGVAEDGGDQVARIRAKHGKVRERVGPHYLELDIPAVHE